MESHYSIELAQAFVAGESEIKKLTDILSVRIGQIEIRADCADDVSRTFQTFKELAAYENAQSKAIRRLHISANSDDYAKRATVDLHGSNWRGISFDVDARDDVVSRLREDMLDIMTGMRPWYSALHRVDFLAISFFVYLFLWVGLLLFVALRPIPTDAPKEISPNSSALAQLIIAGVIGSLLTMSIALNRFRDAVFPRAAFLIGQGKARFQHLERCQWGIVIAFAVSFVAGAIIAIWQAAAG